METTALIFTIGGALFSAVGAAQQASQQQQAAEYNAAIARNNAIIAAQNAEIARAAGEIEKDQHRRKVAAAVGSARAAQAANGFLVDDDVDTTNPILQQDIAYVGAIDLAFIEYNIQLETRRNQIARDSFIAEEGLLLNQASNISPGGAAFSSLLGSSGDIFAAGKKVFT